MEHHRHHKKGDRCIPKSKNHSSEQQFSQIVGNKFVSLYFKKKNCALKIRGTQGNLCMKEMKKKTQRQSRISRSKRRLQER